MPRRVAVFTFPKVEKNALLGDAQILFGVVAHVVSAVLAFGFAISDSDFLDIRIFFPEAQRLKPKLPRSRGDGQ